LAGSKQSYCKNRQIYFFGPRVYYNSFLIKIIILSAKLTLFHGNYSKHSPLVMCEALLLQCVRALY